MAISLLESDRIDRYEFKVYIGKISFTCNNPQAFKQSVNESDERKYRLKHAELTSKPKYTIKIILDDIFTTDISSDDRDEKKLDQCTIYYNDLKSRNSITNILEQLNEEYIVDENPVCNPQNICYNIASKESIREYIAGSLTLNKGIVCVFTCVPRILISILQKNPLELMICEDQNDDQIELGVVSITLSGITGFTDAISHHFYEKGYDSYSHTVHKKYYIKNMDSTQTIGKIYLNLKLTCHGPEKNQANQILLISYKSPIQPIFINENSFDFPFIKPVFKPPLRMMYDNTDKSGNRIKTFNPDIKELLDCQRFQESSEIDPCSCPCEYLLENVKQILIDDKKQYASLCASDVRVNKFTVQKNYQDPGPKKCPCSNGHQSTCDLQPRFFAEPFEKSKIDNYDRVNNGVLPK